MGRTRVIDNCLSGSAQSGLPPGGGRSTAASADGAAIRRAVSPELTVSPDDSAVVWAIPT
jgi:hypothetical protein